MRALLILLASGCGFNVSSSAVTDAAGSDGPRDAAPDARPDAPPDAPPDAAVVCPGTYDVTVAASTTHYRIVSTDGVFSAHHASCNSDVPGATHLAVFDSDAELAQITALANAAPQPTDMRFYVGAVQLAGQTTTAAGWVQFTGGAVPASLWGPGHPEDSDNDETDHAQQLAAIDSGFKMNDVSGGFVYGAICECDGKQISAIAAAAIAAIP